jgi:hypothetical protein
MPFPDQFILRNAKGPRLGLVIPLVIVVAAVVLVAAVVTGETDQPAALLPIFGFGLLMILTVLFLAYNSAARRKTEKEFIENFFAGDIWAHWQFEAGSLAPAYPKQGTSPAFQLWFGPYGVYHDLEGFTPLMRVREVNYLENFTPLVRRFVSAGMGREGGVHSPEFRQAIAAGTIGDNSTPKIEFKLKVRSSWYPVFVYFPVPRGCEEEAKHLVQLYRLERL